MNLEFAMDRLTRIDRRAIRMATSVVIPSLSQCARNFSPAPLIFRARGNLSPGMGEWK